MSVLVLKHEEVLGYGLGWREREGGGDLIWARMAIVA